MLKFFNEDKTPWTPNPAAPVLVAENIPTQAVFDLLPKAKSYKKFQSLDEAMKSCKDSDTFFCKHRYTSSIDLLENVLCGQGSYPVHEYDVLCAENIPTQAVLDLLPKAKSYKKFQSLDEAMNFYKTTIGEKGRYPSKQEFEGKSNQYPPPKVGPYNPD